MIVVKMIVRKTESQEVNSWGSTFFSESATGGKPYLAQALSSINY